ncbi:plasmid replication protein, CyRepA1 family [Lusitaniella coriacea]|uniref:plasmid replication protein, CyRepA1 family n=1 Tax=Lusitaniella coriacea TaxID=1983105 RepID=UPI002D21BF5D|nr:plasmid replication protein, CyRepA1 family [Lusitaniella coriacea]
MNFLQEWNASCVDDRLTRLNVTPLEGNRPYEYLLYSDAIPRRNDGRVRDPILKRYQHVEQGGWWCSGINLLTGEEDIWGCFKPEQPRLSRDRAKPIKYEHPPKAPTGVFALRVPQPLWEKIAQRYNQTILPEDITPHRPDRGFWKWLSDRPQIPLCITEGAKKAGALLTAGYAAIALPGVNGGYRVPRNEWGDRVGKSHLIPQLQVLARPERPIYIVFDQDTKPNTIKAVSAAIRHTGYLLQKEGCPVSVVTWNSQWAKGVDDLIALRGQEVFDRAYKEALPLETWKAKALNQLTYAPNIQLNCRYLPGLGNREQRIVSDRHGEEEQVGWAMPTIQRLSASSSRIGVSEVAANNNPNAIAIPQTAKLIGIKSPKGTGKTQLLESIVQQAFVRGQWVLVIGHRVQLVQSLCQRFGLNYITEVKQSEGGATLGYGLCIDSLHPNSKAQFNANQWSDGVVIIDEVEQVLWHGLNSNTCRDRRVAILKSLKILMQNVLGGNGQVYLADADLSDVSLDYLQTLAGIDRAPFIIQNDWKPNKTEAWDVYNYPESTPKRLVKDLEQHIRDGGKPFVCLSAQKLTSQWGTRSLEAYLKQQFPQARILRIDSESLAERDREAHGCIGQLDRVLPNYDIVLASPSIETGVSIDLKDHFTSVWAIAQGIQGENSVRQAIGRIRANIPRHLWVAAYGFNKIGNGSTSIPGLLNSGQKLTQLNIRLLQQSDFAALDDLDTGFQAESLLCWARFAVRLNASMLQYRESVLGALRAEGHQVRDISLEKGKKEKPQNAPCNLTEAINEVREQNYQQECHAIANAPDLGENEYQALKKRMVKTIRERRSQRKHDLRLRYGIPVTPELVIKDDEGWYHKLRLHYFLTVGRGHLAERDATVARQLIEQGEGSIFLPDFNRSQLGAIVGTMERLGIPVLLQDEGRELRNTDPDLTKMAEIALSNRSTIKSIARIGLAKNSSPVTLVRRFLEPIGYSLKYTRIESQGKKRIRVYQIERPDDGRFQVFQRWLAWDGSFDRYPDEEGFGHLVGDLETHPYVQLSFL